MLILKATIKFIDTNGFAYETIHYEEGHGELKDIIRLLEEAEPYHTGTVELTATLS